MDLKEINQKIKETQDELVFIQEQIDTFTNLKKVGQAKLEKLITLKDKIEGGKK